MNEPNNELDTLDEPFSPPAESCRLLPELDGTLWDGIDHWLGNWHEEA